MIRKLLFIELQKLLPNTTFRVLIILHAGLFLLVAFLSTQIDISMPGVELKNMHQFPVIWNLFTWLASYFNLFLAILIIVSVGNEFSFRMFRQHAIDGLQRNELITGKLLVILILSFYSLILVFLITLVFGLFCSTEPDLSVMFDRAYYLFVYFLQTVAYMSLALLITILLRNTALSIIVFVFYFFPVEPVIRQFFPDTVAQYFPMKIISKLTPAPETSDFINFQFQGAYNGQDINNQITGYAGDLPLFVNISVCALYIAVFILLSTIIMNRRNL